LLKSGVGTLPCGESAEVVGGVDITEHAGVARFDQRGAVAG
jgi:hypothetical protein